MGAQVVSSLDLRGRLKKEKIETSVIQDVVKSVYVEYLGKRVDKIEVKNSGKVITIKILELPIK